MGRNKYTDENTETQNLTCPAWDATNTNTQLKIQKYKTTPVQPGLLSRAVSVPLSHCTCPRGFPGKDGRYE